MNKAETINAIQRINPSAAPAFLCEFSEQELVAYLARLEQDAHGLRSERSSDCLSFHRASARRFMVPVSGMRSA